MASTRAEDNLAFWLGLVGLDPAFPALAPLSDEKLRSSVVTDAAQMEILRSNLASQQLNQIIVKAGWGATTLFRFLVDEARDRVMERLTLPVEIDLETMFVDARDIRPEMLSTEIRRQILGLLVGNPWESVLNRDFYFECIGYDSSTSLARHKADASNLLFYGKPPSARQLVQRFPWLRRDLGGQVNYLLSHFRFQTALYVHLPPDTPAQRMNDLAASIKWILRDAPDMDYAAWREIYVSAHAPAEALVRDFARSFERMEYKKYTPAQVYLMLISRYQPALSGLTGSRQVNLDSVFAPEFVEDAWPEATSLSDLAERVHSAILRRLDCPAAEVPFRLDPARATPDTPESTEAQGPASSFQARRAARRSSGS